MELPAVIARPAAMSAGPAGYGRVNGFSREISAEKSTDDRYFISILQYLTSELKFSSGWWFGKAGTKFPLLVPENYGEAMLGRCSML